MYGPTEIQAFARGLATLTRVDIRLRSGRPCTDGSTVWVDGRTCNTRPEFDARCGTGAHEVAHVFFATPQTCKDWAKRIAFCRNPSLEWAAHECLNVIVDVQDETRFEHVMPPVAAMFRTSNLLAGERIYEEHFRRWQNSNMPIWRRALLAGILYARLGADRRSTWTRKINHSFIKYIRKVVKYECWRLTGNRLALEKVFTICMSARERKAPKRPARTTANWRSIYRKAEELFEVILPFIKPEDEMPAPQSDGDGVATDPANDAMGQARKDAAEAAGSGAPGNGGPSGNSPAQSDSREFDTGFYHRAKAGFARSAAELMETHDSMRLTRRDLTGQRLGRRWTSVFTDGKVYVNPEQHDDEELALAILVDKSSSTRCFFGKLSAAAKAFAETMSGLGADVDCWLFGADSERRHWKDLDTPTPLEDATYGLVALRAANQWLGDHRTGRKMCVVLTDGGLGDKHECQALMRMGASQGNEYVLVGVEITLDRLRQGWMAGLPAVVCDDAGQLGELLVRTVMAVTV